MNSPSPILYGGVSRDVPGGDANLSDPPIQQQIEHIHQLASNPDFWKPNVTHTDRDQALRVVAPAYAEVQPHEKAKIWDPLHTLYGPSSQGLSPGKSPGFLPEDMIQAMAAAPPSFPLKGYVSNRDQLGSPIHSNGLENLYHTTQTGLGKGWNTVKGGIQDTIQNPSPLLNQIGGAFQREFDTDFKSGNPLEIAKGLGGGAALESAHMINGVLGFPAAIQNAWQGKETVAPSVQIPLGDLERYQAQYHPVTNFAGGFLPWMAIDGLTGGAATPGILGKIGKTVEVSEEATQAASRLQALRELAQKAAQQTAKNAATTVVTTPGSLEDRFTNVLPNAATQAAAHMMNHGAGAVTRKLFGLRDAREWGPDYLLRKIGGFQKIIPQADGSYTLIKLSGQSATAHVAFRRENNGTFTVLATLHHHSPTPPGFQPAHVYQNLFGGHLPPSGPESWGIEELPDFLTPMQRKGVGGGNQKPEAKTVLPSGKTLGELDGILLGTHGVEMDPKTTWNSHNDVERIDVENKKPGIKPGNIHYHEPDNTKHYYEPNTDIFYTKKRDVFEVSPSRIQKLLRDPIFRKRLDKGLNFLNYRKLLIWEGKRGVERIERHGVKSGNVRYHEPDNTKHDYDRKTNQFFLEDHITPSPRHVQDKLKDPAFRKQIDKALNSSL